MKIDGLDAGPRGPFARAIRLCVLASLLGAPSLALPAPILYGITQGKLLITIDPATGAGTLVGSVSGGLASYFGLGVTGGKLYTYDQTADLLLELDPATAATVSSIDLGLGDLAGEGGVDFRSNGVGFLNATGGPNSDVYRFTTTAGSGVAVGTTGGVAGLDGLAFDSSDVLFALGQAPQKNLYTVDQGTGALTLIGATGLPNTAYSLAGGLDFIGSTLYASIKDTLYTLDTASGAATLIGPIGFSEVSGLASLDVPEPATFALLGLGFAGLGYSRRRPRV